MAKTLEDRSCEIQGLIGASEVDGHRPRFRRARFSHLSHLKVDFNYHLSIQTSHL